MPSGSSYNENAKCKRGDLIRAKLIAKGLNPRGLGFMRAFEKHMKK